MTNIAREIWFETSSPLVDAATFFRLAYAEIIQLFAEYESIQTVAAKQKISEAIAQALQVNIQLEQEIFYPAIRKACHESTLLSLAAMNHSLLRYLLVELSGLDVDSSIYDIKLRVLGDHVKHYVKEMQRKIAKINLSQKIDIWRLGEQLALRKAALCS